MDLVNYVEMLNFELECAIDNLWAVRSNMEEDQGANWQKSNNAVFSVYLRLVAIKDEIQAATNAEFEKRKNGYNAGRTEV